MKEIQPTNLSAQLAYRARGNPPGTHVSSAISNCFPGLEFDFRGVWKHLFVGLELHESDNTVVSIIQGGDAAAQGISVGHALIAVNDQPVETNVTGPRQPNAPDQVLTMTNLEWTNALADIFSDGAGTSVSCQFRAPNGTLLPPVTLEIRHLFDGVSLVPEAAAPGELTQGLCSPWQADYRECGCYYWAASRPDFVNVEIAEGQARGHNWMLKDRDAATPKNYTRDNPGDPAQVSYEDLYRNWEQSLKFVIGGEDEE